MALGGTVSDFFAIETIAPWLSQAPGSSVGPFGTGLHVSWPIVPYTEEIVLGLVQNALKSDPPSPPSGSIESSSITEGEQVGYVDFDIPLGQPNPDYVTGGVLGNIILTGAREAVLGVGDGTVGEEPPFPDAPVSDLPSFPEGSIYGPEGTWGQNPLPEGIYDIPQPDTRPDELPPPPIPEEGGPVSNDSEGDAQMAVDWGDFISGTAQDLITGFVGGGSTPGIAGGAGAVAPPARVTVDTRTGKVTPCRRRRRRRLLTSSDLNDLAALKTIVGGGQALNGAVIKAVRR